MMSEMPIEGCENISLWPLDVLVAPAKDVYSPPERDVGMLMIGMVLGLGDLGDASAVRFVRSAIEVALLDTA